jgi:hypothetical protein
LGRLREGKWAFEAAILLSPRDALQLLYKLNSLAGESGS